MIFNYITKEPKKENSSKPGWFDLASAEFTTELMWMDGTTDM